MAYIYKITNEVNKKVYIGATTKSIEERMSAHISESKMERSKDRPLYFAIREYGADNFSIETIEICADNKRFDRETYWISYFNSTQNGYNVSFGGKGKQLFKYDEIAEYISTVGSISKTVERFGCSKDTVIAVCRKENITNIYEDLKKSREQQRIGVVAINEKGERFLFNSLSSAADFCVEKQKLKGRLKTIRTHISQASRGMRKKAYGYAWEIL